MKKNLIKIFAFLFVMGVILSPSFAQDEKKVLKTDEKEAVMIDDTKMQDVSDMPTEREIKKFKKEQEKLNKEKQKKEEKELKKQQKEQEKLQKEEIKKEENKEEIKEELPKQDDNKEASKVEQKEEAPVVEVTNKDEVKEEKTVEEIKNEEPVELKAVDSKDESKLPVNKQEETVDKKAPAQLYKKNLTYEDIEKNAVSINEFLQFTDKQNEKFSLYYYKTTAKLNDLTRQIKNKEQEVVMVKRSKIAVKEQLKRLKKLEEESFALYRERDDYYNKALDKFNSMLNKKQQIKWEILQEMGYRFFPEFE